MTLARELDWVQHKLAQAVEEGRPELVGDVLVRLRRMLGGEMDPEQLARRFHQTYESLAPSFGYQTRPDSAVGWSQVPFKNRALMIAVAVSVLVEMAERRVALHG